MARESVQKKKKKIGSKEGTDPYFGRKLNEIQ
jgi:hypothetical protein